MKVGKQSFKIVGPLSLRTKIGCSKGQTQSIILQTKLIIRVFCKCFLTIHYFVQCDSTTYNFWGIFHVVVYCNRIENEKIISQIVGIIEVCDQHGDRML